MNLSQPSAPSKDLSAGIATLLTGSACATPGRYNGGGVLFNQRYVYEGNGGLFAVDVSPSGDVSNLVRLTDIPLRYPEVTGDGYLFAGWVYQVSQWDFYRVGRL